MKHILLFAQFFDDSRAGANAAVIARADGQADLP